jgi:hypothetical protein
LQKVNASTQKGLRYTGVSERTYHRVIGKFKQLGLVKKGHGVYDMTALAELLKFFLERKTQ